MNAPDIDGDEESGGVNQDHPYRVLGVALVVDQKGSGAKLVCRYPTQPNDKIPPNPSDPSSSREDPLRPPPKELHADDDLFFTLTARQMAKLFRTKKTLCGNPMTLSVNGTVFCCRAVLMQGEDGQDETVPAPGGGNNDSHNDDLVLFSMIVALSAPMSHTSVQFSTGSWLDSGTEDQLDIQRYVKELGADRPGKSSRGRVSAGFLAIRRVHLSLARFCRVLEREERRCRYITLQSQLASQIRSDHQKKWEEKKAVSESLNANTNNNKQATNGISSSSSVLTAKSAQTTSERRSRHHRSTSFSSTVGGEDVFIEVGQRDFTVEQEQEKEQEILELMLAASPPKPPSPGIPKHYGNLVRELMQFFHSLSRNDHIYPPTPMSLLIERDGVVYVNQHIAIPVEAAAPKPSHAVDNPTIRPYYTLLFPHASPSDLLQALQSSGSTPPQKLQQLLLTVNAQKPMTEIAIDANLSLNTTLEMASYLVRHGVCVMSPVVSRQSRLACHQVERIPELALEFSQLFGNVHVFRVVGFLTSVKTLGAAMSLLTNTDQDDGSWLRDALSAGRFRPDRANNTTRYEGDEIPGRSTLGQPLQAQEFSSSWKEEMEEQLYAMAVWLISHRVLTQLQEYVIAVGTEKEDAATTTDPSSTAGPVVGYHSSEADENLFRELLESDFLNGEVSIMALSWKLGLDAQKIRSWGLRHRRVRVVSRITRSSDDWESSN